MKIQASEQNLALALLALQLVEYGSSEKGAVAEAANRLQFQVGKSDAVRIVVQVLSKRSLIDRTVEAVLGILPRKGEVRNLARLTTAMLAFSTDDEGSRLKVIEGLRRVCPIQFKQSMESLIGGLIPFRVDSLLDQARDVGRVALETGHPEWWVEHCYNTWGRAEALQILRAPERPRYIHVNPLGPEPLKEELTKMLESSDLTSIQVAQEFGFYKARNNLPSDLRSYLQSGTLQVQDLASFLAVAAAEPKPAEHVLDVCAGPGAKTASLAQLMCNEGMIVSVDYSVGRMRGWRREMRRLNVKIASGVVEDATSLGLAETARFDLILVDPPCSGSGVFDKNPRMKWHLSPQRHGRYREMQSRLLEESSKFLAPSGRILYSTCSIATEENEEVVLRFLGKHPEYETRPVPISQGSPGFSGLSNTRRFYPHRDETAGYFIARLERWS